MKAAGLRGTRKKMMTYTCIKISAPGEVKKGGEEGKKGPFDKNKDRP